MANTGLQTLEVGIWRGRLRQRSQCPQGEGCCTRDKFTLPQRREEAAPAQQLWLPVRLTPIDRHMPTNNSTHSQPKPIHLQLIFIHLPSAISLLPIDNLPLLPIQNVPLFPTDNVTITAVQPMAWNTDAARVKPHTLRTNPHPVPFLDEEQKLRAVTRSARGKSPSRKAVQPVQFSQGFYQIPLSGQGAAGASISWMSTREAIDLECYEQ